MRRDVFQAIADPNRRAIIELLVKEKLTLNSIAAHFDISRPAISKHIKILVECGIVKVDAAGRERYCSANQRAIKEVYKWASQFQGSWNTKAEKQTAADVSEKKGKKKKGKKKKK